MPFFLIKVLGIVIHSVLVDINHALATNLKQLFGAVQTREMGHIGCKSSGNPSFGSLQDSIDLGVKGSDTVSFNDQTFVVDTVLSSRYRTIVAC